MTPLEIANLTAQETLDEVGAELDASDMEEAAQAMAVKSVLHYEEGHWAEARAAALCALAIQRAYL